MTLCTTMLWALFIRNGAAESACDSGCSAHGPWWPGPQVETEGLPSNTRLLVLDESATVTGPDGAALEMVSEPAPGGARWWTPSAGWTPGAAYTMRTSGGGTYSFSVGEVADTSPPTVGEVSVTTWSHSTCSATLPVADVGARDLSDDQSPVSGLFAEVRVSGAPDDEVVWGDSDPVMVTLESGDDCFQGLAGVSNGDTVSFELRYYDQAGNASDLVTSEPVTLYVEHPDSGWSYGEDDKVCGCATGAGGPRGAGLLVGALLLARRRRRALSPRAPR